MVFEPRQKNKAPDIMTLALLVCAAVAGGFSAWKAVAGRGFLQTLSLVLFGLMIFVLVRYKFTRIRYTVRLKTVKKGYGSEDDEEEDEKAFADGEKTEMPITAFPPEDLEFTVEKAQSRSVFVTECLVLLSDIISCERLSADKKTKKAQKKKAPKGLSYRYIKNIVGADEWLMCVKTAQGYAKIIFEPDAKLGEYLSAVAGYNEEKRKEKAKRDAKK